MKIRSKTRLWVHTPLLGLSWAICCELLVLEIFQDFWGFLWFFCFLTPRDGRETIANDFWVRQGCVRRARVRFRVLWALNPSKFHRKSRAWEHIPCCGIVERCAIHCWFWLLFWGNQEIFVFNLYESVRNRSQMVSGCELGCLRLPHTPFCAPSELQKPSKITENKSVRAKINLCR